MHEFFPGVYPWNLAIHLALQMGGVLSEIERETQPLARHRSALPALFVHAKAPPPGGAPGPCMVFFDGFDVNKEFLYYRGPREELVQRGVSLLCVDTPGVDGGNVSVADMIEHARWVFGAREDDELVQITRRFTMDGAAEHITCPFLITHGAGDRQVPVGEAHAVHAAAVNSPRRELRIFTADEGGAEHVNFDHPDNAIDHMADWIVDVLGSR